MHWSWWLIRDHMSGDDLFSALKLSPSFADSNLRHLWHSLDSNCLPVLEMLRSTSYSEPLPVVPTTACSFHSNPLPDTPSKGFSETSASNPNSTPMFFGDSPSRSGDRLTPMASNIRGQVIKVIRDIKGQWWSGSMGNAGWWPWS